MIKNKRFGILFIVFFLFIFVLGLVLYFNNNSTKEESSDNFKKNISKNEAAFKGIDWFIENKDNLPPEADVAYLMNFYKVIPDSKKADETLAIVNDKLSKIVQNEENSNTNLSLIRSLSRLIMINKCKNIETKDNLIKLKKIVATSSADFDNEVNLADKLVAAYYIKKLGVDDGSIYFKVKKEILAKREILENPYAPGYYDYLYALTHIIFADSDYFSRYLDKNNYSFEISGFNKALMAFSVKKELNSADLDILSEIIVSLKILKVGLDKNQEKLLDKIFAMQNANGSWGSDSDIFNAVPHHTNAAILALVSFSPNLRSGDIYCK